MASRARIAAVVVALASVPTGCSPVEEAVHQPVPAVEIVDGADEDAPKVLTLTADAVRRLELSTVAVADPRAIPYAAVVYDKAGDPWVYAGRGPRTFVRVPVRIESISGDTATVSAGPPARTRIVVRAAIKLYGAETGVGDGH